MTMHTKRAIVISKHLSREQPRGEKGKKEDPRNEAIWTLMGTWAQQQ